LPDLHVVCPRAEPPVALSCQLETGARE
jgi:hypothetical protein